MVDDDYELLPHEELERLRKEVEHLKNNPFSDRKQNRTLLDSMDNLATSLNKLIKILEGAQDNLIKEYSDASPSKLLKEISNQNSKIAEGILALAKLVNQKPSVVEVEKKEGPRPASTFNPVSPEPTLTPDDPGFLPPKFKPTSDSLEEHPVKKRLSFLNKRSSTMANFRK